MEEQSDTPRTDAAADRGSSLGLAITAWSGIWSLARDLERELATATRERDEARALNAKWAEKAETWLATPEAAQRLQSYRDLGQQVAEAQNERDEARAEVERLRKATEELYNGTMRQAIRLAATEADRRFFGVGELERTGYIPAGSADEREVQS